MLIQANGIRLFALEVGQGDPALVFIPANGVDHSAWHHQIEHFSTRTRVVALDIRGHGQSSRQGPYDQETLASDLLAVLDALNLSKPILVGWSVGALMATRVTARRPDRVGGLVLVDNAPAGEQVGLDPRPLQETIRALEANFDGEGTRRYIDQWFPETGPAIEPLREWCYDSCRRTGREVVLGIRANGAPPDRLDLLRAVRVPTLIMQGGASPLSGPKMGEYLHSIVPGSELAIFPDNGHAMPFTNPTEFNRVLESFFNRLKGER